MNKKILVLILVLVLMVFGKQGVSQGQKAPIDMDSSISDSLSTAEIRQVVIPSLVWIHSKNSSGSGVLLDKGQKLVCTNVHITDGNNTVKVFFPAYDLEGVLIREKDFYTKMDNRNALQKFGYLTNGRVVAEDLKTDVAIVSLAGLPKTAEQIKWSREYDYSLLEPGKSPVHLFGHPGNRDLLWQWDPGFFQQYHESFGSLLLDARAWYGNSGGPIVDATGKLIGLVKAISHQSSSTYAVPIPAIVDLKDKLEELSIFSIENDTEFTVNYEIKWIISEALESYSLEPGAEPKIHYRSSFDMPEIRYKDGTKKQSDKIPKDEKELEDTTPPSKDTGIGTEHVHLLNCKYKYFDPSDKKRIKTEDSYQYRFEYDSQQKKLDLREPRRTFWVKNTTENPVEYTIWWASSREIMREEFHTLQPSKKQPHWWKELSEDIPTGYPLIEFSTPISGLKDVEDPAKIVRLLIEPKLQFFSIGSEAADYITDVAEQINVKIEENNYHFKFEEESELQLKFYKTGNNSSVPERTPNFISDNLVTLLIAIAGLVLAVGLILIRQFYFPQRPIFSIQNETHVPMEYQVKWEENDDWDTADPLEPGEDSIEWYDTSPKKIPQAYPKVRFDSIVDDKQETQEYTVEIRVLRFSPKTEKKINRKEISREDARQYHFVHDSGTQALKLVDSEIKNE
ncbi:MAG: serine protease [Candidatus Poribacteria bacterium]|nr:serine protease [Candidatus Poribacteria bacterium]